MKTINTESSIYKRIKGGFGFVGATGSMICLDSVALTFVRALFPKSKLINSVAMIGCLGLNMPIGLLGKEWSEIVFDQYASVWNDIADKVNGKEPENDIPEKEPVFVPSRNATPAEDTELVHKLVEEYKLFTFKTEEDAQKAFEGLKKTVDVMGFANLPWYCKVAGKEALPFLTTDFARYDLLSVYGWKRGDLNEAGVEKIRDDEYILDVFGYHDISDVFNILKED